MNAKKTDKAVLKTLDVPSVRASISFPSDLYEALEELAKKKKVSMAWVMRDAAERYVADQSSLLSKKLGEREI
jgi:predicted transcriptional regulator